MSVERIAISVEKGTLARLEGRMKSGICPNRSKAISDILRDAFLREEVLKGRRTRVGTISILYGHHVAGLQDRMTDVQHRFGANIIASMHVHLSHDECLEVVAARGAADKLKKITDSIASIRGIKACKLVVVK